MKMAKDEAESNGHKVLFVCASKPLASMVNSHIGDAVDVKDIRSLFEMLVEDITSYQEPLFKGISHGSLVTMKSTTRSLLMKHRILQRNGQVSLDCFWMIQKALA